MAFLNFLSPFTAIFRLMLMKLETDTPLVSIRDLSFSRGSRPIFENIHLDVARGKVTAIMGPSVAVKQHCFALLVVSFIQIKAKSLLMVKMCQK